MSLARISATCKGFPGASDGKESTCILYHLIGKILWESPWGYEESHPVNPKGNQP